MQRPAAFSSGFSNYVVSLDFNRLNSCQPTIYMWSRPHAAGRLQTTLPRNNTTPRAWDGRQLFGGHVLHSHRKDATNLAARLCLVGYCGTGTDRFNLLACSFAFTSEGNGP